MMARVLPAGGGVMASTTALMEVMKLTVQQPQLLPRQQLRQAQVGAALTLLSN